MEAPLRAIIVDDDAFARQLIKQRLQEAGITVIAEARNGRQGVELTLHYRPDVVLMDVVMPQLDGIIATRRIVEAEPDQIVVILTGADDDDDEIGLQALSVGASGFLSKDLCIESLPEYLRDARAGRPALTPSVTRRLIEELRRRPRGRTGMRPVKSALTSREWEVLDLLESGMTTDAMAGELVLSTETVRTHVKNILRKLEVRSREEAVTAAARLRAGA